MMPSKQWKQNERDLAALFGTLRRPLSGGRSSHGEKRDDAEHDRLYLESKRSKRHAIFSLWRHCRTQARREVGQHKRRVVIGLFEHGQAEALLLVHQDDLLAVAVELLAAKLKDANQPFNTAHIQDLFQKFRSMAEQL